MRTWLGIVALALLTSCGGDDAGGASGGGGAAGTGGTGGQGGTGGTGGEAGTAGSGGGGGSCTADVQTDAENCGICGHSCLGGTCEAGACQPLTLASELAYPYRIAVDATDVYFTVAGTYLSDGQPNFDGFVGSVPIAGGAVSNRTPQVKLAAYGLAVDATNVYASVFMETYTQLLAMAKDGGETIDFSSVMPMFIVLDVPDASATATTIYFHQGPTVYSAPVAGGSPTMLVDAAVELSGLALTGNELIFGDSGDYDPSTSGPIGGGRLLKVATAGGQLVELDPNAGFPYSVAADTTHAYYTDMFGMRVVRVALDGSSVTEIASGQSYPYGVIVVGDYVYWTNRGAGFWDHAASCGGLGSLMRAPAAGGAAEVILEGLNCAGTLTQDANALYWVEQGSLPYQGSGDGSLGKLAK